MPSVSAGTFDAVIAGGGLAGLSLVAHLATLGWHERSVLVVDDPKAEPPAVCWAYWSTGTALLDGAASLRYRRVWVHADGASRRLPLGGYVYQVVRRPHLERVVRRLLDGCPRFTVRRGRVEAVRSDADGVDVTVDGRPVRASWAFDSVSPWPESGPADARLAFTGWEVRCARPVFDPESAVLLDFRAPRDGAVGARFAYTLPDDRYRAFVELTEFVPRHAQPPAPAVRSAALAGYLTDVLRCGGYDVVRTESAVLPLRAYPPPRGAGRVLAIGARGGLVKASTGYAYQRIQRDSAAVARSLVRHGHPFDLPQPRARHRALDAVLLDVLDRDPAELERTFARLFRGNPAEQVLRFLDEDTGVPEELRLVTSMPPAPYLHAAAARTVRAVAGRGPGPTARAPGDRRP
jgi:lycopene beta-cyclase